jgi:hypothetical protein
MAIDLNKDKNELKYYYSENGATLGPFMLSQLLEKIEADTLVYREGIDWTNAKDVEELRKFFKTKKTATTNKIPHNNLSKDEEKNKHESKLVYLIKENKVEDAIKYYAIIFGYTEDASELKVKELAEKNGMASIYKKYDDKRVMYGCLVLLGLALFVVMLFKDC